MNTDKMKNEFYESKRSNSIPFVINDAVEITSGPAKGKLAAVISIEPTETELSYFVEPADGSKDLMVLAKQLKLK